MVVGDVVNGLSAINVALTFQPALGVEVCLMQAVVRTQSSNLTDGVNSAIIFTTDLGFLSTPTKIMLNNTNYISINADPSYAGCYTGIQIK